MCTSKPPVSWTTSQFQRADAVEIPAGYYRCEHMQDGFRCRAVYAANRKSFRCRRHAGGREAPLWVESRDWPEGTREWALDLAKEHGPFEAARLLDIPEGTVTKWVSDARL